MTLSPRGLVLYSRVLKSNFKYAGLAPEMAPTRTGVESEGYKLQWRNY
jgi:hypothetical protein